jgi:hypothetical protein
MTVAKRADGRGEKLTITRLSKYPTASPALGTRRAAPGSTASDAGDRGISGRRTRHPKPENDRGSAGADTYRDTVGDRFLETHESLSPMEEVVKAFTERYRRGPTDRQREMLYEILDNHDRSGSSWITTRLRSAPLGVDPLRHVLEEHRKCQQERRAELDGEDAERRRDRRTRVTEASVEERGGGWFRPLAGRPGVEVEDELDDLLVEDDLCSWATAIPACFTLDAVIAEAAGYATGCASSGGGGGDGEQLSKEWVPVIHGPGCPRAPISSAWRS